MTWEEFKMRSNEIPSDYLLMDVECPCCGKKLYKYMGIVLTSYPPKFRYDCLSCGWSGTA